MVARLLMLVLFIGVVFQDLPVDLALSLENPAAVEGSDDENGNEDHHSDFVLPSFPLEVEPSSLSTSCLFSSRSPGPFCSVRLIYAIRNLRI